MTTVPYLRERSNYFRAMDFTHLADEFQNIANDFEKLLADLQETKNQLTAVQNELTTLQEKTKERKEKSNEKYLAETDCKPEERNQDCGVGGGVDSVDGSEKVSEGA